MTLLRTNILYFLFFFWKQVNVKHFNELAFQWATAYFFGLFIWQLNFVLSINVFTVCLSDAQLKKETRAKRNHICMKKNTINEIGLLSDAELLTVLSAYVKPFTYLILYDNTFWYNPIWKYDWSVCVMTATGVHVMVLYIYIIPCIKLMV